MNIGLDTLIASKLAPTRGNSLAFQIDYSPSSNTLASISTKKSTL